MSTAMYSRYRRTVQIQRLRNALHKERKPDLEGQEGKTTTRDEGVERLRSTLSSLLSSSSSSSSPSSSATLTPRNQSPTAAVGAKDLFEADLETMKKNIRTMLDSGTPSEENENFNTSLVEAAGHVDQMFHDHFEKRNKLAMVVHEMKLAGWLYQATKHTLEAVNFIEHIGFVCSNMISSMVVKLLGIVWNYTDVSREVVNDLAEVGMVKLMAEIISKKVYLDNMKNQGVRYILLACVNILHNIAKGGDDTSYFAEDNVKDLLKPFLEQDDLELKALATMTLSAIISEEENSLLEDTGAIPFIADRLKGAVASDDRRYDGFSTTELTEALSRIAVNDTNKAAIVGEGTLPMLVNMLQQEGDDEHEQLAAIRTLWTLAFDDDIRKQIHKEDGCMEALEKLAETGCKDNVKNAASGSLFVINGQHKKAPTPVSHLTTKKQHVFISYSWANQAEVIKIKDRLKGDGFRVWFDKEQMGGSTMDAMAEAVENAAVVLICMSEQYKARPKTRTEAEYTFEQEKPFIPLMMQRHYKPDGWLGLLLGSKFYVNFDGKYEFEEAYGMLLKELKGRGKYMANAYEDQAVDVVDSGGAPRPVPAPPKPSMADWSKQKVDKWLQESGLAELADKLPGCDGKLLARLNKIRQESPDFFYNYLVAERMKLDTMDVLRLIEALASVRS